MKYTVAGVTEDGKLLEGTLSLKKCAVCNELSSTVVRPLDTPFEPMALDQLRQETTHEESANATHMLNQLNLVNLELVHFVVTTGNNRWFGSLGNLLV